MLLPSYSNLVWRNRYQVFCGQKNAIDIRVYSAQQISSVLLSHQSISLISFVSRLAYHKLWKANNVIGQCLRVRRAFKANHRRTFRWCSSEINAKQIGPLAMLWKIPRFLKQIEYDLCCAVFKRRAFDRIKITTRGKQPRTLRIRFDSSIRLLCAYLVFCFFLLISRSRSTHATLNGREKSSINEESRADMGLFFRVTKKIVIIPFRDEFGAKRSRLVPTDGNHAGCN